MDGLARWLSDLLGEAEGGGLSLEAAGSSRDEMAVALEVDARAGVQSLRQTIQIATSE